MVISTPREILRHERRVGLTPFGASRLTRQGHSVLVEKGAGETAHFTDHDYEKAGAQVVYSSEEVYKRGDIVCRVSMLQAEEVNLLKKGSVVCAFHHLAVTPRETIERFMELETTLIGYEIIEDAEGRLPVLVPMSELAGQLAVHLSACLLQNERGGRGILLGSVPGVPPPTVLILGAGTVGRAATRQAVASGAHVIVFDTQLERLRALNWEFGGRVVTVMTGLRRLRDYTSIADVLIGAVLVPGARTPHVVNEDMVKSMKPGSVIVDVSIDQGGCVETSRPTSISEPTFLRHGVVHCCVPNLTANIARTASRAHANAALPYLLDLSAKTIEDALKADRGLAAGTYLYKGKLVNQKVADILGKPATSMSEIIGGESDGS
jgi:alanine dehydrogenase